MNPNTFVNTDDFRSSALRERHNNHTALNVNTLVLLFTRLERLIYTDLRERFKTGLDEIEAAGIEKLSTFSSLIQDVFQAFYSLNPRRGDPDTLTTTARQFNAEIIDSIMSSDEYRTVKSICEGQELPAYEATREFAQCILGKLDELVNTDSGSNAANALDNIERQQEELQSKILEAMESGDSADEDSIPGTETALSSKQQQIERLSEMMGQNIRKNMDVIQSAIASAAEKAQEVSAIIKSWGDGDGSPKALQQNAELLRKVQSSPKLRDVIKYLGKYREILNNARKTSYTYGRGEKYDIVLGSDFTRALSSEYAYLASPETVPLFIRKVQQKKLKQYRKREFTTKGYGDIVVCIDESGSMQGDRIS